MPPIYRNKVPPIYRNKVPPIYGRNKVPPIYGIKVPPIYFILIGNLLCFLSWGTRLPLDQWSG